MTKKRLLGFVTIVNVATMAGAMLWRHVRSREPREATAVAWEEFAAVFDSRRD